MEEAERRRLVRASDLLLSRIEDWRLMDNPERPVPPGWVAFYRRQLGGLRTSFVDVDDLYCELYRLQGTWLRGGPDEEPYGRILPKPIAWMVAPPAEATLCRKGGDHSNGEDPSAGRGQL